MPLPGLIAAKPPVDRATDRAPLPRRQRGIRPLLQLATPAARHRRQGRRAAQEGHAPQLPRHRRIPRDPGRRVGRVRIADARSRGSFDHVEALRGPLPVRPDRGLQRVVQGCQESDPDAPTGTRCYSCTDHIPTKLGRGPETRAESRTKSRVNILVRLGFGLAAPARFELATHGLGNLPRVLQLSQPSFVFGTPDGRPRG